MFSKKNFAIMLVLTMVLSLIPTFGAIVSADAEITISVNKIGFTKDGENVYTLVDGDISTDIYLTNNSAKEKDVMVTSTVYEGEKLSKVSFARKTVSANAVYEKISTEAITASETGNYSTFLWNADMSPICDVIELKNLSSQKEISSFSVVVGGKTYQGAINQDTKEINVFVPTAYGTVEGWLDMTGPDHGGTIAPNAFASSIAAGITPTISGVGTISGIGEAKDFSSPVVYEVTAEDGSKVTYTASIIESKMRMYHAPGTTKASGSTVPKNNAGNRLWVNKTPGAFAWAFFNGTDAVKTPAPSCVNSEYVIEKTNTAENKDIYTCSDSNKPNILGYQQKQIAEVTMNLSDLSVGKGFCLSYFEQQGYDDKNINVVLKRVEGTNTAELYWSRGGMDNGVKIGGVAPITLGDMHTYKVIRTMNPTKLASGKYAGMAELYVDGVFVASCVDSNYITFNGARLRETDRNGSYNMIAFQAVTNDTAENGGVTYKLAIKEINCQTVLYPDELLSSGIKDVSLTLAGKEYKPLLKDGVYTFTVPVDADLTSATPSVTAVSENTTLASEGTLSDGNGMVYTITNTYSGSKSNYTIKANKMTHLLTADFTGTNLTDAAPEGFSLTSAKGGATLTDDPSGAENKVIKYTKTKADFDAFLISTNNPIAKTNGYSVSFKMYVKETSGTSTGAIIQVNTVGQGGVYSPSLDFYRGAGDTGCTYGLRAAREKVNGNYLDSVAISNFATSHGKWIDVTYTLNLSSDSVNHPNGYYYDVYFDGLYVASTTDPLRLSANETGEVTDGHTAIVNPFYVSSYSDWKSFIEIYFDDVVVYYNAVAE